MSLEYDGTELELVKRSVDSIIFCKPEVDNCNSLLTASTKKTADAAGIDYK